MKTKFEMSLSPEYVPHWTMVDAIREIFQNALDQQTTNPSNTMEVRFNASKKELLICSKESVLTRTSLLLGTSSKRNDDRTIGKFGEGYKIASLVLLRLGYQMKILNHGNKEIWEAYLEESAKYDSKVLVFYVDRYIFKRVPDHNLTFVISGITQEDYDQIVESNLHLQIRDEDEIMTTCYGEILLGDDCKGKIFVNGLYVSTLKDLQHGYNIDPKWLELDRDRKLVRDLDIQFITSKMWKETKSDRIIQLAKDGKSDVRYIEHTSYSNEVEETVADRAYIEFKQEYGPTAVPVTNNTELSTYRGTHFKPVIVTEQYKHVLSKSTQEVLPKLPDPESPTETLQKLYNKIYRRLNSHQQRMFHEVLRESERWVTTK